ncbi:unnamed protein product [Caenorhabditis brenneri]
MELVTTLDILGITCFALSRKLRKIGKIARISLPNSSGKNNVTLRTSDSEQNYGELHTTRYMYVKFLSKVQHDAKLFVDHHSRAKKLG